MKREIIIEIAEDGQAKVEAVGFTGGACEAATKAIEEALGVAGSRKRKPDFFASAKTGSKQKVGGK